ncbi:MAG: hypothetical protein NXI10_09790 [bacterium]|nr:hypothetical protein [bacterium]
MKKIIILVVSIAALTGLTYYVFYLMDNSGKSDGVKRELIDFAIKDTKSIDKITITDKLDRTYTLRKKNGVWEGKKGACVTQEKVKWVLDAIENIRFKGYLSDAAVERFNKQMTAQNIKVEIFQNGKWSKTWYIGPSTQDHLGQIMLLDSKESGKSSVPVEMALGNMAGIIDPRFHADPMQWQCTHIFRLGLSEISSVDVKFNDEPQRSFKVEKSGQDVTVSQRGKTLEGYTPQDAYRYLNNFQKVHWDVANYVLSDHQVDSVKRTVPFCVMTVTETSGKSTKLRLFRIQSKSNEKVAGLEVVNPDLNYLWCELPSGELVKCQYFVFSPLISGHIYFPMDLSGVETIDGMRRIEDVNGETPK